MAVHLVLVLLTIYSVQRIDTKLLSSQDFYCQDPDTGKLYPVNSTWTSTKYCEKYICKLKISNITNDKLVQNNSQAKKLETKDYNINNIRTTHSEVNTAKATVSQASTFVNSATPVNVRIKSNNPNINVVTHREIKKSKDGFDLRPLHNNIMKDVKVEKLEANIHDDGDRYLSEGEVKSIVKILQNAKKSDIDAIIGLYNLAQEIYREIEQKEQSAVNTDFPHNKNAQFTKGLQATLKKFREGMKINSSPTANEPSFKKEKGLEGPVKYRKMPADDAFFAYSNIKPYVVKEVASPVKPYHKPYYYPVSDFQRESSYLHLPNVIAELPLPKFANLGKPSIKGENCKNCHNNGNTPPAKIKPNIFIAPSNAANTYLGNRGIVPPSHYSSKPWEVYYMNYNKKDDHRQLLGSRQNHMFSSSDFNGYIDNNNNINPYLSIPEVDYKIPKNAPQHANNNMFKPTSDGKNAEVLTDTKNKAVNVKQDTDLVKLNLLEKPVEKDKIKRINTEKLYSRSLLPGEEWQADPLSSKHVNEHNNLKSTSGGARPKVMSFPILRKLRLEKVGKLLKTDENLIRFRRQNSIRENKRLLKVTERKRNEDTAKQPKYRFKRDTVMRVPKAIDGKYYMGDYQLTVEKITCESDTAPGFFRMGNQSAEFPECCPQRISNKDHR